MHDTNECFLMSSKNVLKTLVSLKKKKQKKGYKAIPFFVVK